MTTTTRTPATPAPASVLPTGHVLACAACGLPGDAVAALAEAELLARTHDALHHGGRPTMQVTGGGTCESGRRRRAVLAWHYPPAGAAFQLCTDCHPAPDDSGPADDSHAAGRVIDLRDHLAVDDHAVTAGDVGHGDGDQVVTATPSTAGGVRW
jgi:hypothetical protein